MPCRSASFGMNCRTRPCFATMAAQGDAAWVGVALVLALVAVQGCDKSTSDRERPPAQTGSSSVAIEASVRNRGAAAPAVVEYQADPALRGYLYRPHGAGPFPAIIYNHGSERQPSNFGGQARFFVPRGFVLFAPHRRGQGLSSSAEPYPEAVLGRAGGDPDALVAFLEEQLDDVTAAVRFTRGLPTVDRHRTYTVGCSLGGVQALLMAERGDGIRGAVNFSGGAMMWDQNQPLQNRMIEAARNAKTPVFFIQAENDLNTAPSLILSREMQLAGLASRVTIFPPHGSGPQDGHAFCAGGTAPAWGEAVLDFLESSGR